MQLGVVPAIAPCHAAISHVFAAAQQGVAARQCAQFGAQREVLVHTVGKVLPVRAHAQARRRGPLPDSSQARTLALGHGPFGPASACTFPCCKNMWHAGGLLGVHLQGQAIQGGTPRGAAQQTAEFHIGNQAVAHGQAVAVQMVGLCALAQLHALNSVLALGREHIAVAAVRQVQQPGGLRQLARPAQQACAKRRHLPPGALLGHAQHLRARLCGAGCCRQQQGPAAGQHNALTAHRQPAFNQRLQTTGTGGARQRPAGKGQQELARAGTQNQLLKALHPGTVGALQQQRVAALRSHHAAAAADAHMRVARQGMLQILQYTRRRRCGAAAPHLSAGGRVVVQHHDAAARRRCGQGGGQTSRPCANNQERAAAVRWMGILCGHGELQLGAPLSTTMPGAHRV